MNVIARTAALSAALALGFPALACAQEIGDGSSWAGARVDSQTQQLATMRQQIPQDTIAAVSIRGLSREQRHALVGAITPERAAALLQALSRATVASNDRPDGASEDQISLADYLRSIGIDPARVVGVTIATNVDRENPPVTVYYRGNPATN
jgi:type IV pilus biogenesis protein CpaD/CtpE